MCLPQLRFTVRRMMAAVAVASWVAFNAHIFSALEDELPPNNAGRVWAGRAMALAVSPSAGSLAGWIVWRGFQDSRVWWGRAVFRGGCAGAAAGGVAWFFATLFLCFGHVADGQTPLAAISLGAAGAALHAVAGAILAVTCWWPPPGTEAGTRGKLPEFLRAVDPPHEYD